MEEKIEEIKVTVQSLINSVPAANGGEQAGPESSSSNDCKETISEVGNLASVIDKASRRIENEGSDPRVSFKHPQPHKTGEDSDTSDSNIEDADTTVLCTKDTSEVDKMVEEVSASIAKLTTDKIRTLSGAQQRKTAKKKQRVNKKGQRDVPKEKDSSTPISTEKGKRIRSPEEQNTVGNTKKKKSYQQGSKTVSISQLPKEDPPANLKGEGNEPIASTSKQAKAVAKNIGDGETAGKKTPPSRKRKPEEKSAKEQPTYAKVARRKMTEELCYAVIDSNSASGKIPMAHQKEVENAINERIVQYVLEADDNAPQIHIDSCRFAREVLFLQLESDTCAHVMKDLVGGIPAPWEGGKLAMVKKADIPSLTKVSFFVKGWGSKLDSKAMLRIIGKQNRGLEVDKWEVFHREETDDGTLVVAGVDKPSMSYLEEQKGKVYFASTTIFFKVGKTPIGWTHNPTEKKDPDEEAKEAKEDEGHPVPMKREELEITQSQEESLLAEQQ